MNKAKPVIHYFWILCDRLRVDGDTYTMSVSKTTCPHCLKLMKSAGRG